MPKHQNGKRLPARGKKRKVSRVGRSKAAQAKRDAALSKKLGDAIHLNLRLQNEKRVEPAPVAPEREGLKRGPKVDPTREAADKCTEILSGAFTPNEVEVMEKFRTSFPFPPTRSQFLRYLAISFMHRGAFHFANEEERRAMLHLPEVMIFRGTDPVLQRWQREDELKRLEA
jgi:hypothetical protein